MLASPAATAALTLLYDSSKHSVGLSFLHTIEGIIGICTKVVYDGSNFIPLTADNEIMMFIEGSQNSPLLTCSLVPTKNKSSVLCQPIVLLSFLPRASDTKSVFCAAAALRYCVTIQNYTEPHKARQPVELHTSGWVLLCCLSLQTLLRRLEEWISYKDQLHVLLHVRKNPAKKSPGGDGTFCFHGTAAEVKPTIHNR